jgi:alkanesulfonate monooxygenase SsuD/methylene tetrahydromethanopterin reductase-like flavin-dependent oxidoreductase (luciferase family)
VRHGVALDAEPFPALVERAQAAERAGLDFVWLEQTPRTGPPLLTVAALAPLTRTLRFVACLSADEHPLAIAEAAVVADNCSNGRLVLFIEAGETADAVRVALTALPFRFEGAGWTIPANLPENDGATERITVTPPSAQLSIPVWTELPDGVTVHREGDIGQLASFGRPRADPLPPGLEAYWDAELAEQIRRMPSP